MQSGGAEMPERKRLVPNLILRLLVHAVVLGNDSDSTYNTCAGNSSVAVTCWSCLIVALNVTQCKTFVQNVALFKMKLRQFKHCFGLGTVLTVFYKIVCLTPVACILQNNLT